MLMATMSSISVKPEILGESGLPQGLTTEAAGRPCRTGGLKDPDSHTRQIIKIIEILYPIPLPSRVATGR